VTMRVLVLAAALLALLSSTGCMGTEARLSHQEYEYEMQALARDMNAKGLGMERLVSAPSEDAFSQLLSEVSDMVDEAAGRLEDINPPEEIDEPHGKLAEALGDVAEILDRAADRANDGDFLGAMTVLDEAPDDLGADVRRAIAEIRTAGYYIGDSDDWG
jgi:hypothetical protein